MRKAASALLLHLYIYMSVCALKLFQESRVVLGEYVLVLSISDIFPTFPFFAYAFIIIIISLH